MHSSEDFELARKTALLEHNLPGIGLVKAHFCLERMGLWSRGGHLEMQLPRRFSRAPHLCPKRVLTEPISAPEKSPAEAWTRVLYSTGKTHVPLHVDRLVAYNGHESRYAEHPA